MIRLIFRDIRSSLGRWIAIFAIIALGTGFLAGLLQTCPAMLHTISEYVRETKLYDWRVVLPDGFDGPALTAQAEGVRSVRAVEAAAETDALLTSSIGPDEPFRVHSVTDSVNLLTVRAGRLPSAPNECFADSTDFSEADLGTTVYVSAKNDDATRAAFAYDSYTVVGVGTSPLYINYERGATTVGNGNIRAFLYIPRDGFSAETPDTDLFIALETDAPVYSESYDRILRLTQRRLMRFAEERLTPEEAQRAYLLSRNNNVGFASFQSDAEIVAGIARVFPVFFFLVAALVCVTTMTRMVDEQRTQIGVMRALGFGPGPITGLYLAYSGSAACLGCVAGFFLGTATIPHMIWQAYNIMYEQGKLLIRPDLGLGALLTVAFLAVSCLATALTVSREVRSTPAQLLRPRPPKAGRQLLIERIPALRGKLDLLWTVSLRNLLRDRGRLLMTVIGVAGCTALLLAAYGIRDSVGGIVGAQFGEVALYDYLVVLDGEPDDAALSAFDAGPGRQLSDRQLMYQGNMDLDDGETVKNVIVAAAAPGELDGYIDFHSGGRSLEFPERGEALICPKLAETFRLGVGDSFTLRAPDGRRLELIVADVFDNYFFNYIAIDIETFREQWGELPEQRTLLANAAPGADIHLTAAALLDFDRVLSVVVSEDTAGRVAQMMQALDYIVILVIFCSGALAFIVLYNLTNINIIERLREIATVKVLGFRGRETAAYVFRENILLSALGALLGLPLGRVLHRFVMSQIRVDLIHFELRIAPISYLWSLLFTFVFVAAVDLFMYFRLDRIHMAEALKSNE